MLGKIILDKAIDNNELLVCVKFKHKLYWKKAKLDKGNLRDICRILLMGLTYKLQQLKYLSKKERKIIETR